jgi:hypothetical protein
MRVSSRSRLALLATLALAVAAVPRPGAAGEPGTAIRAKKVSFAPLFDTHKRFKPKQTVKLRFRAKDKATGAPVALKDISLVLRHGPRDAGIPLAVRELKRGIFEVPFTPAGPGQYTVVAAIRGAPEGLISPVRLGVVGVADGLIEEPPEADAEVKQRKRMSGRSARR